LNTFNSFVIDYKFYIMADFKEKYINPFTDYGFKRLFGEEPNKDLLLDFLNELLKEKEGIITELSYLPNEKLPISVGDRRAIFDIYCTNEKGEQFIVEMQKAEQKFFKDRTIFYSTFPIQEQARNKDRFWDFELKAVYTIGILDFVFEESEANKYRHDVKLTEQETHKVFYDKLNYIYLEMPKFCKTEKELNTHFDKWMYVLKNLSKLDRIPVELKEKYF
jgi:predicted transposase/invertase (TIGR01784 family)